MVSATTEIMKWSQKLPYWQQYALNHIYRGLSTDSEFLDSVFEFFKEDNGLSSKTLDRPILELSESLDFSPRSQLRLKSISNVTNVNCLVPAQSLTIGPNLTTVYGSNGTGKSGYARVIGSAGFSRGAKELLPDATKAEIAESSMQADFLFNDAPVRHELGKPIPAMAGYFVFDSESINTHLSKANSLSFSPAGLGCLKGLVAVVEEIERRLINLVAGKRLPRIQVELTTGDSSVRRFASSLDANSDVRELERLGTLNQVETQRFAELESQIALLVSQDTTTAVKKLDSIQADLKRLLVDIEQLESICTEEMWAEVENALQAHSRNLTAASRVGVEQFQNARLNVVGTPDWDRFVKLSHELALCQSSSGETYPTDGDVCLLCHQTLSVDARTLLHRTWEFAEGEVQREVGRSTLAIENLKGKLTRSPFQYGAERVSYEYAASKLPKSLEQLSQYTNGCEEQIAAMRTSLEKQSCERQANVAISCRPDFEVLLQQVSQERESLLQLDVAARLNSLKAEQLELLHRQELHKYIDQIKQFIETERLCAELLSKAPKTHGITQKHNQLFGEIITDNYLNLFKDYLQYFVDPSVKVSIKTSGAKGESLRQVVLESVVKSKVNLLKILSEGEQRAVAFADYLTEVTLNDECIGLVLDDPVTSFALEWRESAAKVIAKMASQKQVLVFTHDLAFLYYLQKSCEQNQIPAENHWMRRGESDGKPGYIYLNNSPASENTYRDANQARDWYKKAKDSPPQDKQTFLRQGYCALRTSYEVLVIDSLFKNCVKRFEERVSVDSLKTVKWIQSLVDQLQMNYAELCREMEGHTHSDALSSGQLKHEPLLAAIEKFEALKKQIKKGEAVEAVSPPLNSQTPSSVSEV